MTHILVIGITTGLIGGAIGVATDNKLAGAVIAFALSALATFFYGVIA